MRGPLVADGPAGRAARQAYLQQVEANFEPILVDALIASAAVAHEPLSTVSPETFGGIVLVAVPHPDRG